MSWIDTALNKARRGDEGLYRYARPAWRAVRHARLPMLRPFWGLLWGVRMAGQTLLPLVLNFLYREPLLRYRCRAAGRGLLVGGPLPYLIGDGTIDIGDHVHVSGHNTWQVGFKNSVDAHFEIGHRVFIGYGNVFSIAKRITIGDDTMFATGVQIYDNISHPLEPRRRHEPFTLEEADPVTIGRNVWLGTAVVVLKGVTIGDNTIVGAGSVVTRSLPENVFAAGNPAKVVKDLPQ